VGVDLGQIGLHHHGAASVQQVAGVPDGQLVVVAHPVPVGVPRSRRHGRLHDVLAGLGHREDVARLEPVGGDHRQPGLLQRPQVGLVGVPGEDVGGVGEGRRGGDPAGPVEEVGAPLVVVPGAAHHHQVVRRPVDLGVGPHGGLGDESSAREGSEQDRAVVVEVGEPGGGGECDAGGGHGAGAY
jgi:hypothetical protein